MSITLWTVGHSTRPAEEFLAVLRAHDIEALVDVRRFPGSRRHPHFAREQLDPWLRANSVEYHWMPELGGRRNPRPDSPNNGWRVDAFRGYADYMATPEFGSAIDSLLDLASTRRTAVMCAEAVWWRCHRRLISDWMVARGHTVLHIQSATAAAPHALTSPAHLRDGQLSYAAEQPDLDLR